ncbi:hypothetical protein J6590_006263 [Homalodisca vitripennis]|nr:hypothetical protein J6590_006263 [Homalodisca vitripennis]
MYTSVSTKEFIQCCLPWSLGPAERHTGRGVSNNEFQLRCLPWSLGPAEQHTGRDVSQRISATLSSMESWTSRAAHRQGRNTTNFSYAVFHGVLDQQSDTQAGTYHNEFQLRCLPWSLGPAERHTGRDVSQRISATLSSMESWTSRATHRQGRITTNFSYAVFHGVLDQQSGTQLEAYQTTNFSYAVFYGVLDQQSGTQAGTYQTTNFSYAPCSPMESWTSRAAALQAGTITTAISATLSPMGLGPAQAAHRQGVSSNFSYTVSHGVLDQQSGHTDRRAVIKQRISSPLSSMESWTSRAVQAGRVCNSATLSSMESWTSRAAHRQGRITMNFSYAVFHGVLDQQSGTQAGAYQTTNFSYAVSHGVLDQQSGTQAETYHNEFQLRCLPWSLGPAERHTGV